MAESAQIAEYMKIRRYVLSLALKAKEKSVQIPTTVELSRKFGVSRQTVGKAMKELTRDGFIIGKPGIGSFTNPKRIETSQTPCGMKVPTIGIILSDGMLLHLDEYHAKNLSAALKILPEMPAFIRLLNLSSSDPEIILKDLENEQMDALLWIAPRQFHEPVIRELLSRGIPLVLHTGFAFPGAATVEFNFEQAGYDSAGMLIGEKRTGIVFLGDTPPWNGPVPGIRRAFHEAGIPLNEKLFLPRSRELLDQFRSLLNFGFPIQAVYNPVFLYTEIRDILRETGVECSLIASQIVSAHDPEFRGIVFELDFEQIAREEMRSLQKQLAEPGTPPENVKVPVKCVSHQPRQE